MFRYYVSFAHQGDHGIAMAAVDVDTTGPISDVSGLEPIRRDLTNRGYANLMILSFSLYGSNQPNTRRDGADNRASRRR